MKNTLEIIGRDRFLFGASYAPYALGRDWPEAEWDQDLATMGRLGFNTIRIFACWGRIETRESVFVYDKQDRAMDLAAKHGLNVILNMGGLFSNFCGFSPPAWLKQDYDLSHCPNDLKFRRRALAFMERTVKRYADRDHLKGWMIWNEPFAQIPCQCAHCQADFQQWLREKYNDNLDSLNQVWVRIANPFENWSDIPTAPDGDALADWLCYNQVRLARQLGMVDEVVERCDPRKRFTTANLEHHLAGMKGAMNAPRYGLDIAKVAQSMSITGISCYTTEHSADPEPGYAVSYKLARMRGTSRDSKKRTLVLETGAGPNMRLLSDQDRSLGLWQQIAHNAKGILLWNYRSRVAGGQVGLFNLMKWDGSVSRRGEAMGKFCMLIQQHAQLMNRVTPQQQAAILTLELNQLQMERLCHSESPHSFQSVHDSRFGAYKLLSDLKIPTDFISEPQLDELSNYKLLLVPMAEHFSLEAAESVRAFVQAGGTVIVESPFAFKDEYGTLNYQAPGYGLSEVFGAFTSDREMAQTATGIQCPAGEANVCLFWSEYNLKGAEALANYAHGTAAVTRHRYGKGLAILAGTEVFRQYLQDPQAAMTSLLREQILETAGICPLAITETEGVEVCLLEEGGDQLVIILNHNTEASEVLLAPTLQSQSWTCLHSGKNVDTTKGIVLEGRSVCVLRT